jgi:hypothetical protein
MCSWLLFASVLSLPYHIGNILPNETYYSLKNKCGSVVLLLKSFVEAVRKFTD